LGFAQKDRGKVLILKGKKVIVVGGSSGIGFSTAELARSDGCGCDHRIA
jgi:NAD(P)-dependent dehydrogenase (short-subunit alcohol dehydrogenase family)